MTGTQLDTDWPVRLLSDHPNLAPKKSSHIRKSSSSSTETFLAPPVEALFQFNEKILITTSNMADEVYEGAIGIDLGKFTVPISVDANAPNFIFKCLLFPA